MTWRQLLLFTLSSNFCAAIPEGTVRLQGPSNRNGIGRVDIFYNGQWGTICDNSWNFNNTRVVCHQLGYIYSIRSILRHGVPSISGQIWLDGINCSGNEPNLTSCSHSRWGVHKCAHSQDVGVECSSTGKISGETAPTISSWYAIFFYANRLLQQANSEEVNNDNDLNWHSMTIFFGLAAPTG